MSSPAAAAAEPSSPTGRPLGIGSIHKTVERAVWHMWNCDYEKAEKLLDRKRESNPRHALEYAMLHTVRGLMAASNENREKLLDVFQIADNMAYAVSADKNQFSSSDDEDEWATEIKVAEAAVKDGATLTKAEEETVQHDREKLAKAHSSDLSATGRVKRAAPAKSQQWWKLECDVIYADALLIRSILQLTLNSYFRGGINLRKAWGCYWALLQELEKDTEKKIPKEIEMNIKCGAGIFYVYLSLVPGNLMSLLSAIGFISDKELGELYLTEVLESNTVRTPLAALVLLTFYLFIPTGLGDVHKTLAKVKPVLDKMNAMLPNNSYFAAWAMFYHRKLGQTDLAKEMIDRAVAASEPYGMPTLLRYLQGDTLYMSLKYEDAAKQYQAVLDQITRTGEGFSHTGQLIISLAACHRMMGDKDKAMELLKTVGSRYNQKSKQDANSPLYAARVIAEPRLLPLIGVYVLYINRDLAHMQGHYAEKLQEDLNRVTEGEDLSPPEVRAMYWLFMGCMNKIAGKEKDCLKAWNGCKKLEPKVGADSMVMPYLYYEMGELEYRKGNLKEAKELFDVGQALKGEGHETLANRYNIAQKQLKREMKEKGLL